MKNILVLLGLILSVQAVANENLKLEEKININLEKLITKTEKVMIERMELTLDSKN